MFIKPGLIRYVVTVEYMGDFFLGWQRQKMTPTVQAEIETALKTLLRKKAIEAMDGKVLLQGSGRTDSGVNAICQVAHFDSIPGLDCLKLMGGINYFLQEKGAAVTSIAPAPEGFHARFSAQKRFYRYVILNRMPPSPVLHQMSWHIMKPLNIPAMQEAARHLLGHHDFTSFRDSLCQAENPCRTIDSLTVTPHGELIYVDISARAFLHHQVRIITGTLKKFGFSDCNPVEILDILAAKARAAAGETAPAQGLFYLGVQYPEHMTFAYPTLRTADFTLT